MMRKLLTVLLTLFLVSAVAALAPGECRAQVALRGEAATAGSITLLDLENLRQNPPGEEQYPAADAVVLTERIDLTLGADGRAVRRVHRLMRLITELAIDDEGDPRIPFDAARQELNVLRCRTTMRDGKIIPADEHAFNQLTPFAVGAAPDYANYADLVCTHLGLERLALVELEYEIRDLEPMGPSFSGIEFFQSNKPTLEKVVTIRVPAGTTLHTDFLNGSAEEEIFQEGSQMVYRWRLADVPGCNTSARAWWREYLPHLVYGTCPDWGELGGYFRQQLEGGNGTTEALEEKISELTANCRGALDRAMELHGFVVDQVRTVSHRAPGFGITCLPATRTHSGSYGHSFDKAVLLHTMLSSQDIESRLVCSSPTHTFSPEVPALEQLGSWWVVASVDGDDLWLDPTSGLDRHSLKDIPGYAYLDVGDDCPGSQGLRFVSQASMDQNISSVNLLATVDDEWKVEGSCLLEASGVFNPYYRIRSGGGSESLAKGAVGDWFDDCELSSHGVLHCDAEMTQLDVAFKAEAPGEKHGEFVILALPGCPASWHDFDLHGIRIYAAERTSPVVFPSPFSEIVEATIRLPKGTEAVRQPESRTVRNEVGSLAFSAAWEDSLIRFRRELSVDTKVVSPQEYPLLREILALDSESSNFSFVLKKGDE